jgi:hypothetical protein
MLLPGSDQEAHEFRQRTQDFCLSGQQAKGIYGGF